LLRALIDAFAPQGHWHDVSCLNDVRFTIATDVSNPLYGPEGAASVFAAQKGATPEMIPLLDTRSRRFAEASARYFGYDRSSEPGAGAAGGLGYAFLQYLHAERRPGVQLLLEAAGFPRLVQDADLVITGEGSADRQTLMGKLPVGILRASGRVPVCLLAGRIHDRQSFLAAGFSHAECINPPHLPLSDALQPQTARNNIQQTISRLLSVCS
jgi:glycerate kinase